MMLLKPVIDFCGIGLNCIILHTYIVVDTEPFQPIYL